MISSFGTCKTTAWDQRHTLKTSHCDVFLTGFRILYPVSKNKHPLGGVQKYNNLSSHGRICFANLHLRDLTGCFFGFKVILNPK